MSNYAAIVLLGIQDGRSDEATQEFATLEDLLDGIEDWIGSGRDFRAITIVHTEDLPALMTEARPT